jgi:hypothetical protein
MKETLKDFITGENLPNTDMERLRQRVGEFLINEKGYDKKDIEARIILKTLVDNKNIVTPLDYMIRLKGRRVILINCYPTALSTREKLALACVCLLEAYQIPFTVITTGFETEIFDTISGKVLSNDLSAIPKKEKLLKELDHLCFKPPSEQKKTQAKRILYAFDLLKCPSAYEECNLY